MKSVSASIVTLAGGVCMAGAVQSRPGSGQGALVLAVGAIVGAIGLAAWAYFLIPRRPKP